MEKLIIDSGIKEYQINDNGVLRFNPSDPNVYARFMDAMGKIQSVEDGLVAKAREIEKAENQDPTSSISITNPKQSLIKNTGFGFALSGTIVLIGFNKKLSICNGFCS